MNASGGITLLRGSGPWPAGSLPDRRQSLHLTTAPRHMGVIADTLAASLKAMAESDARLYRGLDQHLRTTRQLLNEAEAPALPAADGDIAAAIALLEANGYTVTK